jgi:DNA-binding LacI/PurR family transcriptional regulator
MQTQTIGVIASNLLHPFTAELLRMIYASCHTRGYHLWVGNAEHSQEGWALSDILAADFAENDLPAIAIMKAALMCGVRVPTDLSVVGFDDIAFAALCTPGLTSRHSRLQSTRPSGSTPLTGRP